MQPIELIHGDTTLATKDASLALYVLRHLVQGPELTISFPGCSSPAGATPALGAYWPGEGGYNAGLVAASGDVPAHYLIVAKEELGKRKWGGYEKESAATSKTDGLANTKALLEECDHPAATAVSEYTADGHSDFYLPACAENYHSWVHVPELFSKDNWYWSSTQRSADYAFGQTFDDGNQTYYGKSYELRVRPVRRLFI